MPGRSTPSRAKVRLAPSSPASTTNSSCAGAAPGAFFANLAPDAPNAFLRPLAPRWARHVADGTFGLRADPFWTAPDAYSALPRTGLAVFKYDLKCVPAPLWHVLMRGAVIGS